MQRVHPEDRAASSSSSSARRAMGEDSITSIGLLMPDGSVKTIFMSWPVRRRDDTGRLDSSGR